ncbi:DsbA family protein [Candidatus Peregrinibacteria bacterium]|nr:DsbA family protein [Candidatus Peregrinibacteria bacterium]
MAKTKKKITISSPHRTLILIAIVGVAIGYLFGGILIPQSQTNQQSTIESDITLPETQLEEILEEENNSGDNTEQLTLVENVSIDDDPIQGDLNAPITIIEFSDYQCPFCKRFYEESHQTIIDDYVATDKVRYVYRDFPLDSHPQALPAATAANCAGEQDHYWEMHNMLLDNQDEWSFNSSANQLFQSYASELNLNTEDFSECLSDNQQVQEIFNDQNDGVAATVEQTPTVFINGRKIVGAQPLATYIAIIEGELLKLDQ